MAGKKTRSKQTKKIITPEEPKNNWIDFLHLDESYTSLILGILVVIVASILLVSFVKNRHTASLHQDTSSISTGPVKIAYNIPLTVYPTKAETSITLQPTQSPTLTPTTPVTSTPAKMIIPSITAQPTNIPLPTHSMKPTVTVIPTATLVPPLTPIPMQANQIRGGGIYTVKSGDDLWHIAEKVYGSGYNWVDIARANHLANPGDIFSGNVLELPKVAPVQVNTNVVQGESTPIVNNNNAQYGTPISAAFYTVQKGDSLWTIAQRAYNGNGNRWTQIASANHLANPSNIYSGNVLRIPRP